MSHFADRLLDEITRKGSPICVGIDGDTIACFGRIVFGIVEMGVPGRPVAEAARSISLPLSNT